MNGFNFPKLFKGNSIDIISDKEAVITQFTLLTNSELFEMRYDPGYGSNVPLLKFKPDTPLNRDLLIDAIYDQQAFCPNIRFSRDQIKISKTEPGNLEITIPVIIDTQDYLTDVAIYVDAQT